MLWLPLVTVGAAMFVENQMASYSQEETVVLASTCDTSPKHQLNLHSTVLVGHVFDQLFPVPHRLVDL